jgi:hypothetical protein
MFFLPLKVLLLNFLAQFNIVYGVLPLKTLSECSDATSFFSCPTIFHLGEVFMPKKIDISLCSTSVAAKVSDTTMFPKVILLVTQKLHTKQKRPIKLDAP